MNKQKIARIISEIFNGFLTMMLAPILTIFLSSLPFNLKAIYSALYILLPILLYLVLKKLGKVSDYDLTNRKERPIYFSILTLFFGVLFFILREYRIEYVTFVSLALFSIATAITVVTFFWKISGHMTYSTFLFSTLAYIISPYFFLMFLFTPLIAWSRIELKKHTLAQTIAGTLLTFAICSFIYWGLDLF